MKILLVDDDPQRHDLLREHYGFRHEYRSRSIAHHVSLDDLCWANAVSLDHDMCEGLSWSPCPHPTKRGGCGCPTGQHVARVITEAAPGLFAIVHSANPVGAKAMMQTLNQAGVVAEYWPVTNWGRFQTPPGVRRIQEWQ